MRLIWMAPPALLAAVSVAATGCSGEDVSGAVVTSTVAPSPTLDETTTAPPAAPAEPEEAGARVVLGQAAPVSVPADAVMEIKAPAEWGDALSGLRCTVTDISGRAEDLRSSDVKKREIIGSREWLTMWTFSSPPVEMTVGCLDTATALPGGGQHYVLVAPRGIVAN